MNDKNNINILNCGSSARISSTNLILTVIISKLSFLGASKV